MPRSTRKPYRSLRHQRPTNRARLMCSSLEDRAVPAAFLVNSATDTGTGVGLVGDLRYCLTQANLSVGVPDTIDFSFGADTTINVTSTLSISDDLTLLNTSGKKVTVDGGNANQLFQIIGTGTTPVSLSGLTLTKGKASGFAGGAILSQDAVVSLTDMVITKNLSDLNGGGVSVTNGGLTISGSTISGNSTVNTAGNSYGGGVIVTGTIATPIAISNSTISGNLSRTLAAGSFGYGGGVVVANGVTGTVSFTNCTLSGNTAEGSDGGAVLIDGPATSFTGCTFTGNIGTGSNFGACISMNGTGTLTIDSCRVVGNTSAQIGGFLWHASTGSLTMTNSYFEANRATGNAGGVFRISDMTGQTNTVADCSFVNNTTGNSGGVFTSSGAGTGGILNFNNCSFFGNDAAGGGGAIRTFGSFGGTINLNNCTIVGNNAAGGGGGVSLGGVATAQMNVASTIVAGNTHGGVAKTNLADVNRNNTSGTTANLVINNSLVGVSNTLFSGANNKTGTAAAPLDPLLRPLTNYGGTTKTRLPLPTSLAINAGSNPLGLANDQRGPGFLRDNDLSGVPDIGAVEQSAPLPFVTKVTAAGVTTAGGATYQFTITVDDVNTNVSAASLAAAGAVVVTGGAFGAAGTAATFVSSVPGGDGKPITATYQITPPGGTWDATDNGTYRISVAANKISDDTLAKFVPADEYGSFLVGVPKVIVVNATNDEAVDTDGLTSLREAMLNANTSPGVDTISFSALFNTPQTIQYSLTTFIAVTEGVVIDAPVGGVTIDANATNGLFNHLKLDDAKAGAMTVVINNVTFINGNLNQTAGFGSNGGAVFVADENVTFNNCTFDNNKARLDGGAIGINGVATVTVNNCVFTRNSVELGGGFTGGAISLTTSGTLVVNGCTFGDAGDDSITPALNNRAEGSGGAIAAVNATSVTVTNSKFFFNAAGTVADGTVGGAILLGAVPTSTITGCTFVGNRVQSAVTGGAGGAIGITAAATATVNITGSTFTNNNVVLGNGGAIWTRTDVVGTINITGCTIAGNTANGEGGGGVEIEGNATVNVTGSTISGNSAGLNGGGLEMLSGGKLTLSNSTVSGNTANGEGGGVAMGKMTQASTIQNSTIAFNTAFGALAGGGGIGITGAGAGTLTLQSTIVAGNTNAIAADVGADAAQTIGGDNNLVQVATGGNITYSGTNAKNGLNPNLDPTLALNGAAAGSPLTHALLAGSPALDAGNNLAGLATDQRGFARVSNGTADIGAFEVQVVSAPKVASVKIDDGSTQRSRIRSLTITFDQKVELPVVIADAFSLSRQGGGVVVLSGTVDGTGTIVTLTFSGIETEGTSLKDGRYNFSIDATKVTTGGGTLQLDGDGNGTGGDNYVLNAPANPAPLNNTIASGVWRLFGDFDGDNDVDSSDFGQFRLVYGGTGPSIFDLDNDSDVDTSDFGAFRARFGASV